MLGDAIAMTKFQDLLLNENIDDEDIDNDMSTNLQDLLLMKSKLRVCAGNVGNLQLFVSSFPTFTAVQHIFVGSGV